MHLFDKPTVTRSPVDIRGLYQGLLYQDTHHPTAGTLKKFGRFGRKGDRGGTVVKVLCYKLEGRWFDPTWCHWVFH